MPEHNKLEDLSGLFNGSNDLDEPLDTGNEVFSDKGERGDCGKFGVVGCNFSGFGVVNRDFDEERDIWGSDDVGRDDVGVRELVGFED